MSRKITVDPEISMGKEGNHVGGVVPKDRELAGHEFAIDLLDHLPPEILDIVEITKVYWFLEGYGQAAWCRIKFVFKVPVLEKKWEITIEPGIFVGDFQPFSAFDRISDYTVNVYDADSPIRVMHSIPYEESSFLEVAVKAIKGTLSEKRDSVMRHLNHHIKPVRPE